MKVTRHFARRFRLLLLLRSLLAAAGALLLAIAIAAAVAPDAVESALGVRLAGRPLFGWLLAAALAPMSGACFLAARDPRRYSGVISLAIASQVLAALALGAGALRPGGAELWVPAAAALLLGLSIAAAWLPLRI